MKRFHSPLLRLLRVRQQQERLVRLQVARARQELNAADGRLAAAHHAVTVRLAELESRLEQPGISLLVQQALFKLQAEQAGVLQRINEQAAAREQLNASVRAYRTAQQDRENVQQAVDARRQEHRRESLRAAAVELQEWAVRSGPSSIAADREGAGNA